MVNISEGEKKILWNEREKCERKYQHAKKHSVSELKRRARVNSNKTIELVKKKNNSMRIIDWRAHKIVHNKRELGTRDRKYWTRMKRIIGRVRE